MRSATAARLLLGGACLAAPGRVLTLVGGPHRFDRRTERVTQALGVRMMLQAGLDLALGPRTRGIDVAVELAHATSMLPVAVISRAHRRSALVSAGLATGIALLDHGDYAGPSRMSSRAAVIAAGSS
jgi:hypothetical protein